MKYLARTQIVVLLMSLCLTAYSVDTPDTLSVFANTKERHSSLIDKESAELANTKFGHLSEEQLDAIASEWFKSWAEEKRPCEARMIQDLGSLLDRHGWASDLTSTVLFLKTLRAKNRMDDVILYPILRMAEVWLDGNQKLDGITLSLKEGECPSLDWRTFITEEAPEAHSGKKFRRHLLKTDLENAVANGKLDDQKSAWFNHLYDVGFDLEPYLLVQVLPSYRKMREWDAKRELSPVSSSFLSESPRKKDFNRRVDLYSKFSFDEIRQLAPALQRHATLTLASKAETLYYDEQGKVIDTRVFTAGDRYKDATERLYQQRDQLAGKLGKAVEFEDLVSASLEYGTFDESYVDAALRIEEIRNPKVTTGQKIKDWAMKIAGTGALFLPPPYSLIASVGMVISETVVEKVKPSPFKPKKKRTLR